MSAPAGYECPRGGEWPSRVCPVLRPIAERLNLIGVAEVVGNGPNRTIIGRRNKLNAAGVKDRRLIDDSQGFQL